MSKKIKIISCAVLSNDLDGWADKLGLAIEAEYLEAGLHEEPQKLKKELQKAVDRASREGDYDRIVVGYGLCGLGTVGLRATSVPLVLPRVHDCIALFMGSAKRYREQFSRHPGTLYMSRGWYENKTQPRGRRISSDTVSHGGTRIRKEGEAKSNYGLYDGFEVMKEKYGEANAREIYDFLNSWKKNYTRSVFIDTGLEGDDSKYENYARDLADELDLKYEKISGRGEIFERMLTAGKTDGEVLLVHPGEVVGYDPLAKGVYAYREEEGRSLAVWDRPLPESEEAHIAEREGLGLGIDAGGTYTDAVIYDYRTDKVLAKGKSPTTKWDYAQGIDNALGTLPKELLERVDLTVVSTTLATNAIVENRGRKVGLILMPLGSESGENLPKPWAAVKGKLSIQGEEREPVDRDEVRRVVGEMIHKHRVEAFAVSGYGGTASPSHEIEIREIINEETRGRGGFSVCCGHELSRSLNFYVRANTAVLNAGIIPLLETFIGNLEEALAGRKVGGRVMIVRGDGSLMSREMAKSHPVETALSGPAASVTGARYMVDRPDLLVIDVGGTTSDIGLVESGEIRLTDEGAHVGRWRTHVKAVDMNTLGTGGDSRILIERRELTVGPRRIAPIGRLSRVDRWEEAIDYMGRLHDSFYSSTAAMEVLAVTGRKPGGDLTPDEEALYDTLKKRPYTLKELALTQGHGLWHILNTENLEKNALVQRYGLTPTDILSARGEIDLWDADLARKALGFYETIWDGEPGDLERDVFFRIHRNIMETLLLGELDLGDEKKNLSAKDPIFRLLMTRLEGDSLSLELTPRIKHPLVGVGAAAPFLLEETARRLGTELIIPGDGDVANAVGAVCSLVTVKRTGEVQPGPDGSFLVTGGRETRRFDDFDMACHWLEEEIAHLIREEAYRAGTEETSVAWEAENRLAETGEGVTVFLGRNYAARITGLPA